MAAVGSFVRAGSSARGRYLQIALAVTIVMGILAGVPEAGLAAATGVADEAVTLVKTTDWVEVDGVQHLSNNATAGTFTLRFDGQGPTGALDFNAPIDGVLEAIEISNDATGGAFILSDGVDTTQPIAFNAGAATIQARLEADITAITTVAVTGIGVPGDPWNVVYEDPYKVPFSDLTAIDSLAGGTTTITVNAQGRRGIKSELEKLPNVFEVSAAPLLPLLVGATNGWEVTFVDRAAQAMTATDNLGGSTTTITVDNPGLSVPIDPSGITYMSDIDRLLVTDSEISEELLFFNQVNVWEIERTGEFPEPTPTGISPEPSPPPSQEPTGLAYSYDAATERAYTFFTNDDTDLVTVVDIGARPAHYDYNAGDDTIVSQFSTTAFPDIDLEDVAFDSSTGHLFLAGGAGDGTIFESELGTRPRRIYETTVGGVLLNHFDVSKFDASGVPVAKLSNAEYVISDIEGIEYRASSDTLLITDNDHASVYELTKDGYLLRSFEVGEVIADEPSTLADIALAPGSETPGAIHMYVVDRGLDPGPDPTDKPPLDGKLYELSASFANLAPYVDAGADQAVQLPSAAALDGTAFDDGQPLGALTHSWSKVSGPTGGTVTFGDPLSVDTTAVFSAGGEYVLRLTADDSVAALFDDVRVTVGISGGGGGGGGGGGFLPTPPDTFIDDDDSPYEAAIEWLFAAGITKGCNPPLNDRYCPDDPVTRAQMAAFLLRGIGEDGSLPTYQGIFADVPVEHWSTGYTERLYQLAVTAGCAENPLVYCPDALVNRAQMAAFILRAIGEDQNLPSYQGYFSDVPAGLWYTGYVERLFELEITTGCESGEFCPNDPIMRGQMAAFLARALS